MSQPNNKPPQQRARPPEQKAPPITPDQARRELGFGLMPDSRK